MARTANSSAEAVLGVLSRGTGRTAAEVAEAAGIGRSTATRALAALEAEGRAHREPGGRGGTRRQPDRWSLPAGKPPRQTKKPDGSRLGKGDLAELVLDRLRTQPRAGFTPSAMAKALGGRSGGAVGNALERLVAAGDAVRTAEHPRTYRATPARATEEVAGIFPPVRHGSRHSGGTPSFWPLTSALAGIHHVSISP